MIRKIRSITISLLCFAVILSATFLAPASAAVTYCDHATRSGFATINLPEHQPAITVAVLHYDRGDNGVADYLEVDTYSPIMKMLVPVAIVTDSEVTATFLREFVYKGLPVATNIILVDSCDLQVCRVGRMVFAYWSDPIVGISVVTPQVTLPPGGLMFRGYGNAESNNVVWNLPNGVTLSMDSMVFDAHATFVCPTWNYYGPVGDGDTTMGFNVKQVATHA
ncbi:MAG: hypothetical protein NWE92_11730 [Candidatus Bathyarchaeota archaeon]|nr:hypothetical protein [Candidatus Bathyarchaeota archaeon]